MKFETGCKHYIGHKPCRFGQLCEDCKNMEPAGARVLIIKIGALGDVLRTTSLLPALERAHPGARVAWLTDPAAAPLLLGNEYIHEILPFDHAAYPALAPRRFDLIISLDKEPGPAGLAELLSAEQKRGIGLSAHGTPYPLNIEAEHYFSLGLSDELKFEKNEKTYHHLAAEAVGLEYQGEKPILNITDVEREAGCDILRQAGWDGSQPVVGINTGAGLEFANKMMSTAAILEMIDAIGPVLPKAFIALLGGPNEAEKNNNIARASRLRAVNTGTGHSMRRFAGLVSQCGVVLTGDSLALHMAVALERPVAALFGPTAPQEIDLFGRGRKFVSHIQCAPCYRKSCDVQHTCMDMFSVDDIARAAADLLHEFA
jgi:heptosyltransferase-2